MKSSAILCLCLMIFIGQSVFAVVRTSTAAGGNWGSGSTWVGGVVPGNTDDVIIATTGGNSVDLNVTDICNTLTINPGAIFNGGNFQIQLRGAGSSFVNNGEFNPETGIILYSNAGAVNIAVETYYDLKVGGTGVKNIPDGVVVINVFSGSGGSPTMTSGTFTVGGGWTISTAFVAGSGKVHYNGTGMVRANTYNDLEISGAGLKTMSGTIIVDGTLTINPGAEVEAGSASRNIFLNKTGVPLVNNGTIISGIIIYNGAGAQEVAGGTYNRITINAGGTKTVPAGTLVEVNNQFIVYGDLVFDGDASAISRGVLSGTGNLAMDDGTINFMTTFTLSGTFTAGTGTIEYGSDGVQTMSARPYYNLKTSGAGVKTFASGLINVGGDLIAEGTTTLASSTDLYVEGDVIGAGAITGGGSSGILALKGDWLHTGTFNMGEGVVLYEGNNQLIKVQDYYTLQLANGTKTINEDLIINKSLEIISGTLDIGTHTLNIAAPGTSVFINNGTLAGTGTVHYSNAASQTPAAGTYPNLEFSGGVKAIQGGTNITVTGDWIVNSEVDINSIQDIVIGGNIEGSGNISMGSGTLSIAGNWTNSGTFDDGTGTVIFNGGDQLVPAYTFNNLELNNAGIKTLAGNITIVKVLSVQAPSTLNTESYLITLPQSGTPFLNSGTLTGEGTVHYSATGNQIIDPSDYYNLIIGTGAKTVEDGVNLQIANDLTITGTTVLEGSAILDIGGDLLGSAALTLNSGTIYIAGDWLKTGAFTPNTGTVIYDGADQQVAGVSYYNLQTENTGIKDLQGNLIIANVLTVNTPSTLKLNAHTVNLSGSGSPFIIDGTLQPETSTVNYNNAASTTIAAAAYHHLNISGGSRTIPADGTVSIAGDFTTGGGPFNVTGSTVVFNGEGNQEIPEFTFHDLIISNGGIKTIGSPVTVKSLTIEDGPQLELNTDIGGELNIEN